MNSKIFRALFVCIFPLLSSCHTTNIFHLVEKADAAESVSNSNIITLLIDSLVISFIWIFLALALASVIYALDKSRWSGLWKSVERNLSLWFVVTWILGFCIYCVGMYIVDGDIEEANNIERLFRVTPMGVLHAFGMFLLESDISAVHEEFHSNIMYMTLFSITHLLAAFVSMAFVIKHFGYNIVASVQLWLNVSIKRKKDELFVFWGMNEPSYLLASDIKINAKSTHRILFVKTADEEDKTSDRTGVDRLFHFLSVKNKELENFKELKCLSINAFSRLSKCELTEDERQKNNALILKEKLGLRSLTRLIRLTNTHVHIFMFGEDADSNMKAATNLCADQDVNDYAKEHMITIYCHARYDSVNRVIENLHYGNNLSVRIIDSAHMAIETLKRKKEDFILPAHFVKVESDGTVSSEFKSMVIGMGQCGRDAVKFLYEYGAFVRTGTGHNSDAERAKFTCDVFDKNMHEIGNLYKQSHPAASVSKVLKNTEIDAAHCIRLYDSDTTGELFWQFVKQNIKNENYIVIATKNDDEGITLAVRLLKQAISSGANMECMRIFVRSYQHDKLPYMEAIANHYNETVAESLELKKNKTPICIFGKIKDLYTWANIVDDSMRKESFRYYNSYKGNNEAEENLGTAWAERRREELGKDRGRYANLNAIRRKEMQDMENALHRTTKIVLIEKALQDKNKVMELAQIISKRKHFADNRYGIGERYERIMTSLAQTEHLRWNASHELLGYVRGEDTDEATMRHKCLVSWNELEDDATRGYDYDVVETSLKMYLKERCTNNSVP